MQLPMLVCLSLGVVGLVVEIVIEYQVGMNNEHVKPFKSESVFWHSVWVSSGCPNRGDLYHVMKSSKLQYKYAVRRLKRADESY